MKLNIGTLLLVSFAADSALAQLRPTKMRNRSLKAAKGTKKSAKNADAPVAEVADETIIPCGWTEDPSVIFYNSEVEAGTIEILGFTPTLCSQVYEAFCADEPESELECCYQLVNCYLCTDVEGFPGFDSCLLQDPQPINVDLELDAGPINGDVGIVAEVAGPINVDLELDAGPINGDVGIVAEVAGPINGDLELDAGPINGDVGIVAEVAGPINGDLELDAGPINGDVGIVAEVAGPINGDLELDAGPIDVAEVGEQSGLYLPCGWTSDPATTIDLPGLIAILGDDIPSTCSEAHNFICGEDAEIDCCYTLVNCMGCPTSEGYEDSPYAGRSCSDVFNGYPPLPPCPSISQLCFLTGQNLSF